MNDERYAAFAAQREVVEEAYGGRMDFEDLPREKSTRIGEVLSGAVISQEDR